MLFISEGDIYRLVANSKLPKAVRFERWIFDEVLPSIRHTGGYISGQDTLSDDELLAKALLVAQKTIESRNARISELECSNKDLSISNAMLSKAEQKWNPREVVDRLVRVYSSVVFGNNFQLGWADFHHELQYRKNINLKMRAGSSSLIRRVRDDEWTDVIAVAATMCQLNGINPAKAINQTNADFYLGETLNAG